MRKSGRELKAGAGGGGGGGKERPISDKKRNTKHVICRFTRAVYSVISLQAELVEPSRQFMGFSISVCFLSLLLSFHFCSTETHLSPVLGNQTFFFHYLPRHRQPMSTQEERMPRLGGVSFVDAINLRARTFSGQSDRFLYI